MEVLAGSVVNGVYSDMSEEIENPDSKMNNCTHRSLDLVSYGPPCCSNKQLGYFCHKREIHGLTDSVCDVCQYWEKKQIANGSEE